MTMDLRKEFSRLQLLIGEDALRNLNQKKVAVFGIGGVGGYAAEALARSGVGMLDLIDRDIVDITNINRQVIALHSTVGRSKAEVMKERIADINPECRVKAHQCFYLPDTKDSFDFNRYDYVVDAVDTVTAKILIVTEAKRCHTPVISCMGTGNKMNPLAFEVEDIYGTSVCPLARVMRRELKKRGISDLKVVYSREKPILPTFLDGEKTVPGSFSFVPSAAGLILASEVVKDLLKGQKI